MSHPTPDFITPDLFGRDHISTFLFVETQVVDKGCFKLRPEPRMRTHRHNWRLCSGGLGHQFGDKYGTRLSDGREIMKHDDWDCVQDLAHAGFLCIEEAEGTTKKEYGKVTLTELGWETASELRKYKSENGSTIGFSFSACNSASQ